MNKEELAVELGRIARLLEELPADDVEATQEGLRDAANDLQAVAAHIMDGR